MRNCIRTACVTARKAREKKPLTQGDFRPGFPYNTGHKPSMSEPPMDGGSSNPSATLSLAKLEAQITELAGHLNAANYRWLRLIEEFDRRHGWADGKLAFCAHRLNFKCGLNLGAAGGKGRG